MRAIVVSLFLTSLVALPPQSIITIPEVKLPRIEQIRGSAPTLTLPAEIRVKHGLALIVPLENTCDDVSWNILDEGIEPLPPGLMAPPGTFCVQTFEPGTYRVQAVGVGIVNGKAKITPFQVTKVIVGPVGPGPGPGPTPEPTDPLFSKLKASLVKDAGDIASVKKLAALYRAAPDALKAADVKTCGDLVTKLHNAAESSTMIPGKIKNVRMAIADELDAVIVVAPTTALTDALRSQYTAQFARVAALLEALK